MSTVRNDVKAAGDLSAPFDAKAAMSRLSEIDTMTLEELDQLEALVAESLATLNAEEV